jgi:hypothetical protein
MIFLGEEFLAFTFKMLNVLYAGNTLNWFEPISIMSSLYSAIIRISLIFKACLQKNLDDK